MSNQIDSQPLYSFCVYWLKGLLPQHAGLDSGWWFTAPKWCLRPAFSIKMNV